MKKYRVHVNGVPFEVELEMVEDDENDLPAGLPAGRTVTIPQVSMPSGPSPMIPRASGPFATAAESGKITSPLTGAVIRVIVKEGQAIKQGTVLLEIDAMKMNTKVFAPANATVMAIHVKEGDNVTQGQLLISTREE
jgi:glutaconyl-CoA/methylmalonyl-CoA decarboxylase subunit gamma